MPDNEELPEGIYTLRPIATTVDGKVQFVIVEGTYKGHYVWGHIKQFPLLRLRLSHEEDKTQIFIPKRKGLIKPIH